MDPVPLVFWKENYKFCIHREDVSFLSSPETCGVNFQTLIFFMKAEWIQKMWDWESPVLH